MADVFPRHNFCKVRVLYFLKLRELSGSSFAGAGTIAKDAELFSVDSLYILLGRWTRWGLVKRNKHISPYTYALASQGRHYLASLNKWYEHWQVDFEMLIEDLRVSFYWRNKDANGVRSISFITYPYKTEADYQLVLPDPQGRFMYNGKSQIRIQKGGALRALNGVRDDLGLVYGRPLLDKLVAEGFLVIKKQEAHDG